MFKVKPWLGMCNMILISSQYEWKPECQPVNLPTGHPLTFPLSVSCLMGLKLHERFHETLSSWHFSEHDCSCVAARRSCSAHSCPKLKFASRFTSPPRKKSEASKWVINHSSLIFKSGCIFYSHSETCLKSVVTL